MSGLICRSVCRNGRPTKEAGPAFGADSGLPASASGIESDASAANLLKCFVIACLVLLQGCIPRSVLIHDGLQTTVVDAASQAPIADAFVFDRRDKDGRPIILARSNEKGRLSLLPAREFRFVPLLSEASLFLLLTVCKAGYEARTVVTRGGWNADFGPSRVHEVEFVPLARSLSAESADCRPLRMPEEFSPRPE